MWILSCIAVVFALSWLPLTIFTIVVEFRLYVFKSAENMYLVFVICHILAMTSACTNPMLYGYLNTNFRRDLTNMYYSAFGIDAASRRSERRRRMNSQTFEGRQLRTDPKSANTTTAEPISVVVRNRDRRTSSSFGTTLTTTFRTRSSSCGIMPPRIEEMQ